MVTQHYLESIIFLTNNLVFGLFSIEQDFSCFCKRNTWPTDMCSNFSMAQNQSVPSCHESGKLFCDPAWQWYVLKDVLKFSKFILSGVWGSCVCQDNCRTCSFFKSLKRIVLGCNRSAYSMLVIRSVPVAFQKFCCLRFLTALMILVGSACCL